MVTITRPDGTTFEQSPEDVARDKLEIQRQNCIQRGGRWDGTRCILPERDKPVPDPKQPSPPDTRTRIQRDEFGNIISTTTEPLRPITKEERLGVGLAGIPEVGAREALTGKQALGVIQEEREKLAREQTPEVLPLQPTLDPGLGGDIEAIGGEAFPIIGPLGTFGKRNFAKFFGLGQPGAGVTIDNFNNFDEAVGQQFQPDNVTLRNEFLTEIANKEINRGLTRNERVGEFVEALSLGDLTNFAAEKPSENVQTVLKSIRLLKTDATDVETKVIRGTLTIPAAEARLDEIEGELILSNFRMKMLIQNSPELKFDSDGVNFIEQKVLQASRRVFDARNGILAGATQDPTELQILADLRRSIDAESFEI